MGETGKKIAVVFGTRPDAVTLAPVIRELKKHDQFFSLCIVTTAQNRETLDDVLTVFTIAPDYDLSVVGLRHSLSSLAQNILERLDYVLAVESPDLLIVQGDTVTAFASGLAAFHRKIPIVHMEAGLRSGDRSNPFPDEGYRRLLSRIADIHFTATGAAAKVLQSEGISKADILCTGSTAIDALHHSVQQNYLFSNEHLAESVHQKKRIVVVTVHRQENLGDPMLRICAGLKELARIHPFVKFVFPVHLNPAVREPVFEMLKDIPNIMLLEPMNYAEFVNLVARSVAVITDSGSLQEEAHSLGKPVILLRDVTEQTDALKSGAIKIVGTDIKKIVNAGSIILRKKSPPKTRFSPSNLYGDGLASQRAVEFILKYFGFTKKRPNDFRPTVH